MIPLHILAPSFNHKWILHNMGDELAGAYWAQCGPHNYTGVSNNIIKRNKNGTDFSKDYNKRVKNAFKKHGVTNFMFISSRFFYYIIEGFILEIFEELKNEGDKTIANLKFSFGRGGDTGPEARAKMSGEKNPMFGKTGEKHPMFGKSPTPETRKKQSEANRDTTIYNFQHKDGRIETCTQWALRTKYGLHSSSLSEVMSGKGRYRSTGGWSLA